MPPSFDSVIRRWLCLSLLLCLSACKSTPKDAASTADDKKQPATQTQVDVSFLLTMTYDEARKISGKSLAVPPFYKIAADEITVLKSDSTGQPQRVRAKGHVFLQIDFREQLQALGQEAYIESNGEIILRGKPLLKRGRSVVEGLSDYTVYYIKGTRLQVIGSHRLAKQEGIVTTPETGQQLPAWNVTPNWQRSWKDGPNPILPALSPDDIPQDMRASPLLPMPEGSDIPKELPPNEPLPPVTTGPPAPTEGPPPESTPVPPVEAPQPEKPTPDPAKPAL